MRTVLDGTDNVSVHTVTIIARISGRNKITVVVRLPVELTAELGSTWNWCCIADGRSDVIGIAIVTDWTAYTFLHNGRAAVHVKDALLHDAGRVIADTVAQVAGFLGIRRDLGTIFVEQAINDATLRLSYRNRS